jgi:hypothetical protein
VNAAKLILLGACCFVGGVAATFAGGYRLLDRSLGW